MRKIPIAIFILALCILCAFSCKKSGKDTDESNEPPTMPANPIPSDNATDIAVSVLLRWSCTDPDPGDTLVYDVMLGISPSPDSLAVSGCNRSSYSPGQLKVRTRYYWQVIAHDSHGHTVTGPVWNFTTLKEFPSGGLVAYFPFNGNANDESGNGFNGTPMNGCQLTIDRFGNGSSAFHFDGIDDYILLNNSTGIDLGANFSITAFLCAEAPTTPADNIFYTIIAKRDEVLSGNANLYPWNFGIDYSQPDYFRDLLAMRTGSSGHSEGIVNGGFWEFVSLTVSNDTATFWINTVKRGQFVFTSDNVITKQPILIGWNRASNQQFKGTIDDLRIFARALSEKEIVELSKEGT
jgi:hypothetical protein